MNPEVGFVPPNPVNDPSEAVFLAVSAPWSPEIRSKVKISGVPAAKY
jgi:hypothetical protein